MGASNVTRRFFPFGASAKGGGNYGAARTHGRVCDLRAKVSRWFTQPAGTLTYLLVPQELR